MSADEKLYAESVGVSLIETPIALDALVFLLNKQNVVKSLTVKQVQDIYLGNITNWNELGGANEAIKPFIRNANSGSQEMMKEIVMDNTGMPDWEARPQRRDYFYNGVSLLGTVRKSKRDMFLAALLQGIYY